MEETLNPIGFLESLRRRWRIAIFCTVFFSAVGIGIVWILSRTYTTSALLLVRKEQEETHTVVDFQTLQTIERLNETIAQLAVQPGVLRRVQRIADVPFDEFQLRGKVSAIALPKTELIRITASDTIPERAQLIANSSALAIMERLKEIEEIRPTGTSLVIAEEAPRPPIPSSTPKRIQAIGVALSSLIVGAIAARLRELTDRRVYSEHDVIDTLQLPIVGKTFRFHRKPEVGQRSRDAFREIQSTLQFLHREDPATALAITGTMTGEGKSTTTANLAVALNDIGEDVVILDLDIRKPSLHRLFNADNATSASLANILLSQGEFPPPLKTQFEHISLYPAGVISAEEATRFYQSARLRELLHSTLKSPGGSPRRWVIADLPPLLLVPGAIAAAVSFRNALFVIELGRPHLKRVHEAVKLLRTANVNILGAILTKMPHSGATYGQYYSGEESKGSAERPTAAAFKSST